MIVRLLPDQIAKQWPTIRHALEGSLPPMASGREGRGNRLLESLLTDRLHCWVLFHPRAEEEEGVEVEGFLFTTAVEDSNSGAVNLMVYALYGFTPLTEERWKEGVGLLARWAKSKGYEKIVAYTNNERVVVMAQHLGGRAEFTFISFNVEEVAGEGI